MVGKSRRSKRRKLNPEKSSLASPQNNTKVVSLATRRPRRPRSAISPSNRPPIEAVGTPPQSKVRRRRSPINPSARRFRLRLPKPILYPLRFIIVGVGIGAFLGTVLAISNSRSYINVTQDVEQQAVNQTPVESVTGLPLKTPLVDMAESVKQAIAADETLKAALLFVDLDTGEYLDVDGDRPVSAASTIKIPILIAFLEAVDQGKVHLDDTLTLTEAVIGDGSGSIQYKPLGSTYSALYIATQMSVNSDNTATNMIMAQLGGQEVLNTKFREWGMTQTQINALLPDMEGTNLTTAKDLAHILARISQGEILTPRSRDRLFRIMGATSNDRLLPQSLGQNAEIIHKTGDIGTIIGDAGIIDLPNGKRYVASIFVERPYNAPQGKELLHKISRQFYEYIERGTQPKPTPPVEAAPPTGSETQAPEETTSPSETDAPDSTRT